MIEVSVSLPRCKADRSNPRAAVGDIGARNTCERVAVVVLGVCVCVCVRVCGEPHPVETQPKTRRRTTGLRALSRFSDASSCRQHGAVVVGL